MPALSIALLGPPRIELDGAPLEVDTRKAVALLAYLAMTGQEHRRDRLATLLWPEYDDAHARAALRRTLSVLNKAVAGAGLVIDRTSARLDAGGSWLDVERFRSALGSVRVHEHRAGERCSQCVRNLEEAVALHRDDFLAGFALRDSHEFDDWQFYQAESLRRELAEALDDLARILGGQGRWESAIGHARRRLRLDPLHEPAHATLMRMYTWAGQRGAALRQYRECVAVLDEELGVPPLEETTELYREVRDDKLEPPDGASLVRHEIHEPPATTRPPRRAALPLVGRDEEVRSALAAYEGRAAEGLVLLIEGEAGIGKTRLVEELIDRLRSGGATAVAARSHQDETGLAFGLMSELLRAALVDGAPGWPERVPEHRLSELTRVLPEITDLRPGLPAPPPLDGLGAQRRFTDAIMESLHSAVGGSRPGVVFVDDLQWIDRASLDTLSYLVRRLPGRSLCLIATARGEETGGDDPSRALIAGAEREGTAMRLPLGRLQRDDVAALALSVVPGGSGTDLGERLYRETEGLPYFVAEYLAALAGEREGEWFRSGGVRSLVASRLASVDESARQVLGAAAVIGRFFDYDTLREASGRSEEETIGALEMLESRGLIQGDPSQERLEAILYDFTHDKVRSFVYESISLARRRLLHRRAAEALARRRPATADGQSMHALIAHHHRLAGQDREAAHQYALAGRHAASLYANAEALAHYEAASALGYDDPAELHERIGDLRTLQGDYTRAMESYEAAAARSGGGRLASLEHKLGNVHLRRGNWGAAESHYEAALAVVDNKDPAAEARLLADLSLTAHRQGSTERAHACAEQALARAETAADGAALAQAHNILGMLASRRGDVEEARRHLDHSLALAEDLADASARVAALNNLALVDRLSGALPSALERTREALELCALLGDRHREAALHNNLADTLHELDRSEEAMQHLKRAVTIFAEIGEPDVLEPEIWKLSEW